MVLLLIWYISYPLHLIFLIQKWLEKHGPFDAVMDAANVGLSQSHLSLSKASMLQHVFFYLG
jgi:hypothetical protein